MKVDLKEEMKNELKEEMREELKEDMREELKEEMRAKFKICLLIQLSRVVLPAKQKQSKNISVTILSLKGFSDGIAMKTFVADARFSSSVRRRRPPYNVY
nr:probable inactive protein kinase isoform X1 [Tanacetum cinerariifolium]